MESNYFVSMIVEGDPGGTGLFTLGENSWGTRAAPLGIIAGYFHGPSTVEDIVVLNDDGTISYFLNVTKP